jgi:lysophospholipase L1-like esterase
MTADAVGRTLASAARRFAVAGIIAGMASGSAAAQPSKPIRWSVIGASIAEGSGYPAKLQSLLGPAFQVENEGVSGTGIFKRGEMPYWTRGKLPQTFAFKPDAVSIDLGANDSQPQMWGPLKDQFIGDYEAMIDTLASMPSKPKIIAVSPQPTFMRNGTWAYGLNNVTIRDEILPKMKQIAAERKVPLADAYTPLQNLDLTGDGVHPDPAKPGADSIAAAIYRAYKGSVTRIACIGNSITDNSHNASAYPIRFNQLMGRDYLVLNAGYSGSSLIRSGPMPYYKGAWFKEVFKFLPDVITIKLGTNDSQPAIWDAHKNEYAPDLRWLVDTLMSMPSHPRIFLCTPIPAWKKPDGTEAYGIRGEVIKNEIIPKVKQVAQEKGLAVLDLYTPFLPYQALTVDGVHPNDAGLDTLAHILYRAYKSVPAAIRVPGSGAGNGVTTKIRGFRIPNPLAGFGVRADGKRGE